MKLKHLFVKLEILLVIRATHSPLQSSSVFAKKTSTLKEKLSSQAKRADSTTCQCVYNLLDSVANIIPKDEIIIFTSKGSAKGWNLYAEIAEPNRLQAILILKERWRADSIIAAMEGEKFLKAKVTATKNGENPTVVVALDKKEIENNLLEIQNSIENTLNKLKVIFTQGISRDMSNLSLNRP